MGEKSEERRGRIKEQKEREREEFRNIKDRRQSRERIWRETQNNPKERNFEHFDYFITSLTNNENSQAYLEIDH